VDFGVSYFPTDESIEPAEMAVLCEERGFESVFVTEHSHVPTSRETPHPAFPDQLPREYIRIHDPFVALGTMAQATERIRIGTAICLVVQRDPIQTAKEVASVDRLSGGRFLFGVGAGWLLEEIRDHGTDPDRRFKVMRERIEAMREIWTQEEAEYHGEFVEHNIPRIEELQRKAAEAGRDRIPVTLQIPPKDPDSLRRYEEAGVTRSVFMLRATDAGSRGDVERKLDEWTGRIEAYPTG
jgi:alkanesulfonate monooxygenase SsuD/methylene tetrahydromethanopterin reductase-like flavin-dependent oxidoreductase (luciferase family)